MRTNKYAIYALVEGEEKKIEEGSVRFSRANWRAQQLAKYYPGVFFKREGDVLHKPRKVTKENYHEFPGMGRQMKQHKPVEKAKTSRIADVPGRTHPLPERLEDHPEYMTPDPVTGESLQDIHVDLIRRQAARSSNG